MLLSRLNHRRNYFQNYLPKLKVGVTSASFLGLKNTCPSCGFPTLDERIRNEICRICSWQDDGQDDPVKYDFALFGLGVFEAF